MSPTLFANAVKTLKRVSIISCLATYGASFLVITDTFPTKASKPMQYALMATACAVSTSGTVLMHFTLRGYCLSISSSKDRVLLKTMKLFNPTINDMNVNHLYFHQEMINNIHVKPEYRNLYKLNHFYVTTESLDKVQLKK